jgi:putative membrane protein
MNFKPLAAASALMAMVYLASPVPAHADASMQTTDFVRKASQGNMFEIESSKIALKKSSAKDVKDFAQAMVTDHTQIGDQFKKTLAASNTGLTPATQLASEDQKTLDILKAAPAPTFDNQYVQAQSKAHDGAVSLFSDYAENGDNTDLKTFAADTLPTLKKHQDMVHTLSQSYMSSSK